MAELTTALLKGVREVLRVSPQLSGAEAYHAEFNPGFCYYWNKFRDKHSGAIILQYLWGPDLVEFGFHHGTCVFFYSEL